VRSRYLDIARAEPQRVVVVDAARDIDSVTADTADLVQRLLDDNPN
jgi:thymidylate kinase